MEKRRDNKGRVLRNGEVQRPDGKYMFRYTDSVGKRRTVYSWKLVSTDKLKEGQRESQALRDKEKRILKDLDDKIKTNDAEHITINDLFCQFLEIRKDLKESTRCCYIDIYNKHVKPVIGNKPVGKIRSTELQKLYQSMVCDKGLSATTAQKAHSILFQILENAVMDNVIRINPSASAFRNFRKAADISSDCRDPLTVEQQAAFVNYVYSSQQYGRLANLFTVLLGTGARIGEALGLRWCDCNFEEGIIHITHTLIYKSGEDSGYHYRISSPKTVAGIRDIPMLSDVRAALLREREKKRGNWKEFVVDGYTDFVFLNGNGQVYTQAYIYDSIQGITTSYNKEESARAQRENRQPCYLPKISAHIFRHTFCTRMCENEVNLKVLQDIMGHRNIRTTMEVYAKALKDKKAEAMQALDGTFKIA